MAFATSSVTVVKDQWIEEGLGTQQEFWMMLGAESFTRLMQTQKKSVVTSVLERGRFQKMMREERKELGL